MNAKQRRKLLRKHKDVITAATVACKMQFGTAWGISRHGMMHWSRQAENHGEVWLRERGLK